jgi:hypothetical protein
MDLSELVKPITDKPAKLFVDNLFIGEINTLYQLNNIRLKVAKGELDKVSFVFTDQNGTTNIIGCDSRGFLDHWPTGFFDIIEKQQVELLWPLNETGINAKPLSSII